MSLSGWLWGLSWLKIRYRSGYCRHGQTGLAGLQMICSVTTQGVWPDLRWSQAIITMLDWALIAKVPSIWGVVWLVREERRSEQITSSSTTAVSRGGLP
jgi:hypothetical protein